MLAAATKTTTAPHNGSRNVRNNGIDAIGVVTVTTTTATNTTNDSTNGTKQAQRNASAAAAHVQQTSKTVAPPMTKIATATLNASSATTTTIAKRTTITSDPGILCFHHCNVKVFCFTLPRICPNCQMELYTLPATTDDDDDDDNDDATNDEANGYANNCNDKNSTNNNSKQTKTNKMQRALASSLSKLPKLLPFRLPYPFVRATQYPCAIVLRPSVGDFLNDYNNSTDLHIAVTTSTGCIVEFDRNGLQRHRPDANTTEWLQCLLVGDVPEPWYDYWDQILMQTCKDQPARWTIEQYDEQTHNCYTFVLAFLQALAYEKFTSVANSKTSFCERFIVPRTTTAGKYISLYRKLRAVGIYVHHAGGGSGNNKKHSHGSHYSNYYYYAMNGSKTKRNGIKAQLLNAAAAAAAITNGGASSKTTGPSALTTTTSSASSSSLSNNGLLLARAPTLCTIEE